MNKRKLSEAINEVFEELNALSEDEFKAELKKHEHGDITRIILETNALYACEIEAESSYDDYRYISYDRFNLPVASVNRYIALPEVSSYIPNLYQEVEWITYAPAPFFSLQEKWGFGNIQLKEILTDQLSLIDKEDIFVSSMVTVSTNNTFPYMQAFPGKAILITSSTPGNDIIIRDEESELEWAA